MQREPSFTSAHAAACADEIIARVGQRVVVAAPLGLGKPHRLLNALYARAADDPAIKLEIHTALSLSRIRAEGELATRLLGPINERLFGDCPELAYAEPQRRGQLPPNISVVEFFFPPGQLLDSPAAQQSYACLNYTAATEQALRARVNVFVQVASPGPDTLSLSSNGDVGLELIPLLRDRADAGERVAVCAETSERLPFMPGNAEVDRDAFDVVFDPPDGGYALPALPRQSIDLAEHWIGLHAAALLRDGGTVQLGIGSLSDAVAHAASVRHREPGVFRQLVEGAGSLALAEELGGIAPFEHGLYSATEMLNDAIFDLYRAGILRRAVDGAVAHAGFFLGSRHLYESLAAMDLEERARFQMKPISFVNDLHRDYETKVRDRAHARFVNNGMVATALGSLASESLADGRVVGGVGGQFDFASMAHKLPGARSVMLVRATRGKGKSLTSNIVYEYGHTTIPRQLRDVLVTEYGIADLRGRTDAEVIARTIAVADSRFQAGLVETAKKRGKLPRDFRIAPRFRNNLPERLADELIPFRRGERFAARPFESDFTDVEVDLMAALKALRGLPMPHVESLAKTLRPPQAAAAHLERMGLSEPRTLEERTLRRAVLYGLASAGIV